MRLTAHELRDHAEYVDESSFRLTSNPFELAVPTIPLGMYELPRRSGEAHLYRLHHPLAEAVIEQAKARTLARAEVRFSYEDHVGKITALEPFVGQSGWLTLSALTIESLDQSEDHLVFGAITDGGAALDDECAARLLTLPGTVTATCSSDAPDSAEAEVQGRLSGIQRTIGLRNAKFFDAETDKLEGWADDIKLGLEREIKQIDKQVKEARRAATGALTLEEKLAGQKRVKALESQRNEKRRSLFEAQDRVDQQREELIAAIEGKLTQKTGLEKLFTIRWTLA